MIYFDNNSTTEINPAALQEMQEAMEGLWGNPSSVHALGQRARRSLSQSRHRIARVLSVDPEELVFTGGGTESNHLAILGSMLGKDSDHTLYYSALEHSSVLGPATHLQKLGHTVVELPGDTDGRLQVEACLDDLTGPGLVTLQLGNNETGMIQPIVEFGLAARKRGLLVHCDAVQGLGKMEIPLRDLPVDMATFTAHKVHGPPGIGLLFLRRGTTLPPLFVGGDQEQGHRPGTENVPGAVGFARAVEEIGDLPAKIKSLTDLKQALRIGLAGLAPDIEFTGNPDHQICNTLHFSIPGIDGQDLILAADLSGIALSTGSACHQATGKPSSVLTAMGLSPDQIRGAVRLSLGANNTQEEVDIFLEKMGLILARFRNQ